MAFDDLFEGFMTIHAGHPHVQKHELCLGRLPFQQSKTFGATASGNRPVSCLPELLGHGFDKRGIVVDQQNQ